MNHTKPGGGAVRRELAQLALTGAIVLVSTLTAATALTGHLAAAFVLAVILAALVWADDVFADLPVRARLAGYRIARDMQHARWATVIDGAEVRHLTREEADAWAATQLAGLPEGTEALIDHWITDESTGLKHRGRPGVWQFHTALRLERGQIVEVPV